MHFTESKTHGPLRTNLPTASRALLSLLVAASGFACTRQPKPATDEGAAPAQRAADKKATLVLRGGRVVTVDEAKPRAQAIAVAKERILAVGTNEEIQRFIGPATEVIELEGRMAMPGFIEGHGHFLALGKTLMQLDLRGAATWTEIVNQTAEAAKTAEPGSWILGFGWHQAKWTAPPEPSVDGGPVHGALSAASPDHPVFLVHASGHAAFANAKALALAGIDAKTPDPAGGTIVRDAKGKATGLLREKAQGLVRARIEDGGEAAKRRQAQLAAETCLARGITSFQDAGTSVKDIALLRELAEADEIGVRLWVMLAKEIPNEELAEVLPKIKHEDPKHRFTVNAIKRMRDGALGSHGALLLEPYADMPTTSGLPLDTKEALTRTAELAKQHGFQLCTHAIGDRGNRDMLDIYEEALGPKAGSSNHRWRIEHAQHLDPADVPRFARLGVIASMQGVHCTSDGPWVPERLGPERAERTSYLWRALLDSGAVVSNGTDAPVESVDPLPSYYASVTRMMNTGKAFYPEQVMTRDEALKTYTLDAAYAAFEEDIKGSLTPGKLADITVLSQDITTVPAEEILKTKVITTIVGGEVRYAAE